MILNPPPKKKKTSKPVFLRLRGSVEHEIQWKIILFPNVGPGDVDVDDVI